MTKIVTKKSTPTEKELPVVKLKSKAVTPKKKTGKKRVKKYLNNADLLVQLALSHKQDKMTEELAKMFNVLIDRYASKGRFAVTESFKDDMKANAQITIVKFWKSFKAEKYDKPNPFAYFTTVVRNAFYQYQNHERKHRDIKNAMLIEVEKSPSYAFMANYEEEQRIEKDNYEGTNIDGDITETVVHSSVDDE